MKLIASLLAAGACFFPLMAHGAETAQAKMWCLSLRFQHGAGQDGMYSLDLTTFDAGVNGELAPDWVGSYTHSTGLVLTDELFGDQLPGVMFLNIPDVGDADGDGFPDFFEVSQPVSATSSGTFNISGFNSGTVRADWGRTAGSHWGTCVLTFKPSGLYTWEVFTHSFELLEYTGPLSYTPGSNTVNGSVNLTQTDNPGYQMLGPVQFVKTATNRFNELTLQVGNWTNEAQQTLSFARDIYSRDSTWPTNYYGYFDFYDPANATAYYPYGTWILSIDDLNDANHNGIPDFSDDVQLAPPSRPLLTVRRGTTNLWLTISGDVGRAHQVQESLSVPSSRTSTNWQTVLSVILTNSHQVVSLPLPSSTARFWQVRAQ
jgi:hypothetical protein